MPKPFSKRPPELPKELSSIVVYNPKPVSSEQAVSLAQQLQVPLVRLCPSAGWYFHYQGNRLFLSNAGNADMRELSIDFDRAVHRTARANLLASELLIKAVGGLAKDSPKCIVDATAGMGADALLLWAAGHKVTMIERSPWVAALLANALVRLGEEAESSLRLLQGDACLYLKNYLKSYSKASLLGADIIYLDPMFPVKGKAAKARKPMQALKELVQHGDVEVSRQQEQALLEAALSAAKYRVVVKRPLKALELPGPKPSFNVSGKLIRYDCYALSSLKT